MARNPGYTGAGNVPVRPADIRRMGCQNGKFILLGKTVLSGPQREGEISPVCNSGACVQMDPDNLPLLEGQNML